LFLAKAPRLGILPIVLGILFAAFDLGRFEAFVVPLLVVISVLTARLMYKKGWTGSAGVA
jgi:hypothetical protein